MRVHAADDEEEILHLFEEDPTISAYMVADRIGMLEWILWFTTHHFEWYTFHYEPVKINEEDDPMGRLDFRKFLLNADNEDLISCIPECCE